MIWNKGAFYVAMYNNISFLQFNKIRFKFINSDGHIVFVIVFHPIIVWQIHVFKLLSIISCFDDPTWITIQID